MSNLRVFTLVAGTALLISAMAMTQEKRIKRSDLPTAVEKTVEAESKGATIRGFAREVEDGRLRYEAELMLNGHSKDVTMDATGAIVEVEEQVAIGSLPPRVKEGLQARAGKAKLLKVESIVKHDKVVAYEAQVMGDGKRSEVQVGPDGKPLDHEE